MIKFLNGYKNYLIVSLTVNKYFKPQIPSWRVFIHSIGHNIGTQAAYSFLSCFSILAIVGKILPFMKFLVIIFGNKDLTISYIGSLGLYGSNSISNELFQTHKKIIKDAKKISNSKYRQTWFLLSLLFVIIISI